MDLERYSRNNEGQYPLEIQELVTEGTLVRLPRKPFASKEISQEVEMKPVLRDKRSAGLLLLV